MDFHPSDWSEGTQISLGTGICLAVAARNPFQQGMYYSSFVLSG